MKNIFVGNLDFSATESSVRALFEPYGKVDRVNVVTDLGVDHSNQALLGHSCRAPKEPQRIRDIA